MHERQFTANPEIERKTTYPYIFFIIKNSLQVIELIFQGGRALHGELVHRVKVWTVDVCFFFFKNPNFFYFMVFTF